MKPSALFLALTFVPTLLAQASPSPAPVQLTNTFRFTVPASLPRAFSLFGPEAERCWAHDDWNPVFVYPQPARDVSGAVFTVAHGAVRSIWVNTAFDQPTGHIQYVAVIPDALTSTVDLHLTPLTATTTSVCVTYIRTALTAAANPGVTAMAQHDKLNGPSWQQDIEACLKTQP